MIGDRRPLSLKVQATSGAATSSDAVSLGLIVTELVINALKHAFQIGETGEILVGYDAREFGWTLSVSDNGTGPGDAITERPHAGLGTSIVEALARQLDATVQKSGSPRGHDRLNCCKLHSGRLLVGVTGSIPTGLSLACACAPARLAIAFSIFGWCVPRRGRAAIGKPTEGVFVPA